MSEQNPPERGTPTKAVCQCGHPRSLHYGQDRDGECVASGCTTCPEYVPVAEVVTDRIEENREALGLGKPEVLRDADDWPNIHPAVSEMLRWFDYDHLAPHLQDVVRPFAILAKSIAARTEWQVEELDEASGLSTTFGVLAATQATGPELTVALRKLLEAKDCAVRAVIAAAREEEQRLEERVQREAEAGGVEARSPGYVVDEGSFLGMRPPRPGRPGGPRQVG